MNADEAVRAISEQLQHALADLEKTKDEREFLKGELARARGDLDAEQKMVSDFQNRIEGLNPQIENLEKNVSIAEKTLDQKTRELSGFIAKNQEAEGEIAKLRNEIVNLAETRTSGRIWEQPLTPSAAAFVPLTERGVPIISIVNLKGGVGKTTITANLGAILGAHGKRVLLIDLDYQRSLTEYCNVNKDALHVNKRSLQHFLLKASGDPAYLLRCCEPVLNAPGCKIIGNTEIKDAKEPADSLEDTEMYLQAQWLTNRAGGDVRTLLRRALHSRAFYSQFDIVLLDCPPRLSAACINGLAASDFAIVPIELDSLAALSAPNLLRKMRKLKEAKVLEHIEVLGVLANSVKFHNGQLIRVHRDMIAEMADKRIDEAWGRKVTVFETKIKQDKVSFFEALQRNRFVALLSPEFGQTFTKLMDEVLGRMRK